MRLCTVFYELKIVFLADSTDLVHVCGMTVEVDNKDCLSLVRYLLFNLVCVYLIVFIRLNKYRCRVIYGYSHYTCDVGVALNNDFIALADSKYSKGKPKSIKSVCNSDRMLRSYIRSKLFLEFLYFFSKDVPSRAKNLESLLLIFFLISEISAVHTALHDFFHTLVAPFCY